MKKGFLLLTLLILPFLILPMVSALPQPYHLKLLAVQDNGGNFTGSEADVFLEILDGSGRVFLETTPLTKLDTQISTKFAKDIACNYYKLNCGNYDFFYTIRATSNIVGGPSAGAAIAALTSIALLDLPYDEKVTITGTINSGGIIGPVGGVKEKIDAAAEAGLKKVLVAQGVAASRLPLANSSEVIEDIDLIAYGKEEYNLEIVEVSNLDEVLFHLTGRKLNTETITVKEDKKYSEIMQKLQERLCKRMEKIEDELKEEKIVLTSEIREGVIEKKNNAQEAIEQRDYYSAASFCFGNNIQLKQAYYTHKEASFTAIKNLFERLEVKVKKLENKLGEEEISTISDLQTLLIVKERLSDVRKQITEFTEGEKTLEELYNLLAYAEERYYSAVSWTEFFSMEGKTFILNREQIESSCIQKISEAQEREQYASLFLGKFHLLPIREKISRAEQAFKGGEPGLCLMIAAQAKSDANAILSSLGINNATMSKYIASKREAVERVISENSAEDIFPILGYSYYQYANSLEEQDQITTLVYLEYALEMSELSMYFSEEVKFFERIQRRISNPADNFIFIEGFVFGSVITLFFVISLRRRKRKH